MPWQAAARRRQAADRQRFRGVVHNKTRAAPVGPAQRQARGTFHPAGGAGLLGAWGELYSAVDQKPLTFPMLHRGTGASYLGPYLGLGDVPDGQRGKRQPENAQVGEGDVAIENAWLWQAEQRDTECEYGTR